MSGQADLARGWLLKADSDLATAAIVAAGTGPYDTACCHAQQAIEKSLKAVLACVGAATPRTHNLEDLGAAALKFAPGLSVHTGRLSDITPFVVGLRYDPEFWPDHGTAVDAIATAQEVRRCVADVVRGAAKA